MDPVSTFRHPRSSHLRSLRVLAPAGGFLPPWILLSAFLREKKRTAASFLPPYLVSLVERRIKERFRVNHVRFTASGKASLYMLFQEIKAKKPQISVATSAYGCPDITAAALRAGCRVLLFDVDTETLAPRANTLAERPDVVVLSNLYGLIDPLEAWRESGVTIVDDAAQGGLGESGGRLIGTREGTRGILSFGRGKAICGIGGGCVLGGGDIAEVEPASITGEMKGFLKAIAYWMFEHPFLYTVPANLPFLDLGAVHYESDFSVREVMSSELLCALAQLERLDDVRGGHAECARQWHAALSGAEVVEPFVARKSADGDQPIPVRYPVLFQSRDARNRALVRLRQAGLGASESYGDALPAILRRHGAEGMVTAGRVEGAETVAERVLTVPVHRFVRQIDIEQAAEIIRAER